MDILPSLSQGRIRLSAIFVVLTMVFSGMIMLIGSDSGVEADEVITSDEPIALAAGQRSGTHDLDLIPPEYLATASEYYFGGVLETIDINADGYEDLVVGHYSSYQTVSIFDGKTQLKFPNLMVAESSARWIITGNDYYMGRDFDTGDVNGDGYMDLLISHNYYRYTEKSYIFYGGPQWDSRGSVSSTSADVTIQDGSTDYNYFGRPCALGDLDGDGYDDIIVGAPYQSSSYGRVYYWFGSATMSGTYTTHDSAGYFHGEYYNYLGGGELACGDFNGDGRDDLAIGSSYHRISNSYGVGSVYLIMPKSNFADFSGGTLSYTNTFDEFDKAFYRGLGYYSCYGKNIQFNDYNGDGYEDMTIGSGYISTSTSYVHNTEYLFLFNGNNDPDTGSLYMNSEYDIRFRSGSSNRGLGAHDWGDYDGDGKDDLLLGEYIAKKAHVVLHDEFNGTTGDIDILTAGCLHIEAPSGANYFAYPGGYSYSYSYNVGKTLTFWDRDNDGYDDIFVADYYYRASGSSTYGAVFGISAFDMFGIGEFEVKSGDAPDGNTFYAEHRPYSFSMSAWNRWDILATERMKVDIYLGPNYMITLEYTQTDGLQLVNDPLGAVRLDPNYRVHLNQATYMMFVDFNMTFTMNLKDEVDIDVEFSVYAQHIHYTDYFEDVGKLRNKFRYVGYLETYWLRDDGKDPLNTGSWMPGNNKLEFTGLTLVYNGTEDWDMPMYPTNDLFYMSVKNNLGNETIDDSSSGRNFTMQIGVENKPVEVFFTIEQIGLPANKLINDIPGFSVKVDTDNPTIVPGIQIHADDYEDMNTLVDNDGELFVTWQVPGEYNSGILHYEVMVNGDEENIIIVKSTFAKVMTMDSGRIDVMVRAVDRVGQIGEWGSSFIYIDSETLEFTNFFPGDDEWFNTLTPEVGITITDLGGRAVIGSSVEYSVSYDGGTTYSEWMSGGSVLNANNLMVVVEPALMEGTDNMVMFRAMDEAGNILESESGRVNIDTSGVTFGELLVDGSEDWDGIWLDLPQVEIGYSIIDELSGVDPASVEYRMTTRGRADLNSAPWESVEVTPESNNVQNVDDLILDLDHGDRNFIQFRARDILENAFSYSPTFNLWVNTIPVPVISSPEDGAEFLDLDVVTFDAMKSSDYDGDTLTYQWVDNILTGETNVTEIIGEGTIEDFKRFEQTLSPGKHLIRLMVSDGLHDVYSEEILIRVNKFEDPIWNNADDEDGDGMPNWFEFNFHLGWDDASNKDSIYNAASHDGKSKEELWILFEPEYKDNKVAITKENDFDGDGHSDYEEFLSSSDPTDETDFPLYKLTGEEEDKELNLLLLIAIIVSVLLVIIVLVLLVVNNIAIKNKLEQEAVKDAENEQAMLEQAMLAGGSARLDALKAASEGRPVALPTAPPTDSALPAAPIDAVPQPMEAAPMGEAQPIQPAPMEPAPIPAPMEPAPVNPQGGFPPQ